MRTAKNGLLAGALAGLALVATPAMAPRDFSTVEIKSVEVTDSLYVLVGAGGNIGVSVGADGAYLIEDQFTPLSEKVLAAIRALSDGPIRLVVNTHRHGDHAGGNENMGAQVALVMAHENVWADGFLHTETFVDIVYQGLAGG